MARLDLLRYFAPIAGSLADVEEELRRLLASDLPAVARLADHVGAGQGKRLRPALVLLAARFCGAPEREAVRFGAVFELIHTATLLHDDVIDHAALRRNKPTLNSVWGNTLTVLFGDLLYLRAMDSAIRGRNWRLMEIFAEVTTRMIEGELIQNDCLYNPGTTRKDYFEIQERKTALLFGGCTECAAVLAGRPEADCAALRNFGLGIGRAFQLVDDLLDYTATSEQLGKPTLSDLREGKLTLPMLTLLEKAPAETEPIVRGIWEARDAGVLPPGEEARLRALLARHDALAETRRLAAEASRAADVSLAIVDGEASFKALLGGISRILLDRSR